MEEVLSRKEKLAAWRAAKGKPLEAHKPAAAGGGGGGAAGKGAAAAAGRAGKKDVAKGVLQARPGAGNRVNKRTAPPQRKPFQVDTRSIQQASERRVQPGTPIHSLKKRLKRTAVAAAAAADKPAPAPSAPAAAAGGGASVIPTARAQGKAKAAAAARVPGHVNGVSRSLDSARTKEVSDYLKSQISEANMLLEVNQVSGDVTPGDLR